MEKYFFLDKFLLKTQESKVCPKKVGLFQFKVGWLKIKARTNLGPQNYMYLSAPGLRSMGKGIQYGGGITSVSEGYSVQMCHTPSVWRRHIISMVEGIQYGPVTSSILRRYSTTKTAQSVVGGCIYLGKLYFTENLTITQIPHYCG